MLLNVQPNAVAVQFQGLDQGKGPEQHGSHDFLKSLDLKDPVLDDCIVAYAMNDEPLPLLNGFPVRLVVPGYFATYWVKSSSWIRLLDKPDENFWMKTGYRVPDTPHGNTTPEDMKAGKVKTVPISRMPVRSFIIAPDGEAKLVSEVAGYSSRNRFQWLRYGQQTGSLHGRRQVVESCRTGRRSWTLFLQNVVISVDAGKAGEVRAGSARHGRKREYTIG